MYPVVTIDGWRQGLMIRICTIDYGVIDIMFFSFFLLLLYTFIFLRSFPHIPFYLNIEWPMLVCLRIFCRDRKSVV